MLRLVFLLWISLWSVASFAGGYPEDNTSWLLLDKKYGRYYVIRVTMDTFTTGTATVSSTSNNWYRFPAAENRRHKFKISLFRDGFQLYSHSLKQPLIDTQFTADRSRFSGVFNDKYGGTFDAELRGATDTHVPIYRVCGSGPESLKNYQCTDLMGYGMNATSCKKHPTNKRTFGTASSCIASLAPKKASKTAKKTKKNKLKSHTAEDGWLLDICSPMPRTKRVGEKLVVRFFNDLFEPIQVVYVNGKGEMSLMMTLETGDTKSITTYENHAFAFFLPDSKECLFTHRIEKSDGSVESSMRDLMVKHDTQRL